MGGMELEALVGELGGGVIGNAFSAMELGSVVLAAMLRA